MKTIYSVAVALLTVFAATPGVAQDSEEFHGSICEIDTAALRLSSPYVSAQGTSSVFTFNTTKLCTGVASKRNIKLECIAPLGPEWGNRKDVSVKNFKCTINGDQCGVKPKPTDTENAPYLTTRESNLKVRAGIATLTCFYKP
jgi:hypothetical protein